MEIRMFHLPNSVEIRMAVIRTLRYSNCVCFVGGHTQRAGSGQMRESI